jgi:3-keto-disaccharide hydrolase
MYDIQNNNTFVKLFDGKTLDGWKMAGKGNFLIIESQKALLTQGGMGLLWYYKKKFRDFILTLEWKVSKISDNSGIFVRFPNPFTDPNIAIEYGYEIQIDDIGSPDGHSIHRTGAIYNHKGPSPKKQSLSKQLATGRWNIFEIIVIQQSYSVTLNKIKIVTNFIGNRSLEGYIGLQNHDDGSKVYFRNIMIKELKSKNLSL